MTGMWRRLFGNRDEPDNVAPSPDVIEAMDASARRLQQARRIRREVDHEMEPVREALQKNGFEAAVLATFERRHA